MHGEKNDRGGDEKPPPPPPHGTSARLYCGMRVTNIRRIFFETVMFLLIVGVTTLPEKSNMFGQCIFASHGGGGGG